MQLTHIICLGWNFHGNRRTANIFFLLLFGFVHFSLEAKIKESFIKFHDGSCYVTKEDPYDLEREIDINIISDRAYPLLNCTSFDKEFLRTYQFNDSIRGFLLQKSDLELFDVNDLSIFPELKTVEFRDCTKTKFLSSGNSSTQLGNICSLSITHCGLKYIPLKLLEHFPNILRLTLTRNNISRVGSEGFHICPQLQSINLGHNPLEELNTTWLSQERNIQRLSLRATNIADIRTAFKDAQYLQFLDLSDNKIESVSLKPFRKSVALTTLILANNKITEIHKKALKGAINLRYVDLTENRLETLPEGLFDYSPQDELTVELWENPFKCDCKMKWLKLWLKELSLRGAYPDIRLKCHNPIRNHGKKITSPNGKVVSESDLSCLPTDTVWKNEEEHKDVRFESTSISPTTITTKLTRLVPTPYTNQVEEIKCPSSCQCYREKKEFIARHSRNHVTDFPLAVCINSSYASMPTDMPLEIRGVIMSKCKWTKVNFRKMNLPDLTTLVLNKNKITTLVPLPNKVYESVTALYLEDNAIETISKAFLASFPNLQDLTLYNNRITSFADDLFMHNRKLNKLLLGPNPLLTEFNGKCLENLSDLYKLGLRGIKLRTIPSTLKNKENLHRLDLSDNLLNHIQQDAFSNCSFLSVISLEHNNISRIGKAVFRKMTYLASVDLSENALTSVSPEMFSSESLELSHVELWQNPIRCDCTLLSFVKWVKKMEHEIPSTEIRFRCEQPWKMKGKTSDDTSEEDYVCDGTDLDSTNFNNMSQADAVPVYSKQSIILAVVVTAFVCLCFGLGIKFLCKKYNSKPQQRRDNFFRRQYYKISTFSSSPSNHREQIVQEEEEPDVVL